jgi:hypothetical protein
MEGEELRKLKKSVFILLGIFIGVWILLKIPFEKKINQTITAGVYINGVEVEETTVVIDGGRSNYLLIIMGSLSLSTMKEQGVKA